MKRITSNAASQAPVAHKKDNLDSDIRSILETQQDPTIYRLPICDKAISQPWHFLKPVLHLDFVEQLSYDLEGFADIKNRACVGSDNPHPRDVIYGVVRFHSDLHPESKPVRMAVTLHFGEIITEEYENIPNSYALAEHAVQTSAQMQRTGFGPCNEFDLVYQGESYICKVTDISGEHSRLSVYTLDGVEMARALI